MSTEPQTLTIAFCLYPGVTSTDYQGPADLFGNLIAENFPITKPFFPRVPPYFFELHFLGPSLEPLAPMSGPKLVPQLSYSQALKDGKTFDIVLIPGGPGSNEVSKDLIEFVKEQSKTAKYVLSVCTGSWILANAGLLEGKKATTNKALFKMIKAATSTKIDWVPKARWVVDGRIWTSSGVTAGLDMANAFLVRIDGEDIAQASRAIMEVRARDQGDDEFAEYFGLCKNEK